MSRWWLEVETAQIPSLTREVDRDRLLVGRAPECEIQLPDLRVSRQHCRVERRGGDLWVEDLGSRRGTLRNGRLVEGVERLGDRDVLELSEDSRIVVRAGEVAPHTVRDRRYERQDQALGWDEYCPDLTIRPLPGHHLCLLDPPVVDVLARLLDADLRS